MIAALATVAGVCLVAWLAAPFVKPLVWALIIGVATIEYYRKLVLRMPAHPDWAAVVMVLFIAFCMILPVTALTLAVGSNAAEWLKEAELFLTSLAVKPRSALSHHPAMNRLLVLLERMGIDITGYLARLVEGASGYLVDMATTAARNMAEIVFTVAMSLFILFFVYRDGDRVVSAAVALFPEGGTKMRHYLREIRITTSSVMVGTLFTAFMQGLLAGLGYYFAGLPVPVLLGILTGVGGLVPVIGTTVVWAPVVLLVVFAGSYLRAALLALWCILVVIVFADTVIRPLSAAGKTDVPALAVVLGAIGGAMAFGLLGLIMGPIVFGIIVTIWRDLTGAKPL